MKDKGLLRKYKVVNKAKVSRQKKESSTGKVSLETTSVPRFMRIGVQNDYERKKPKAKWRLTSKKGVFTGVQDSG